MLRLFMEHMLFGPAGMATVGQAVVIHGVPRLIFAKVTNILSDGDGHRWLGIGRVRAALSRVSSTTMCSS